MTTLKSYLHWSWPGSALKSLPGPRRCATCQSDLKTPDGNTDSLFPMHLTIHLPKEILVRLHHVHLTQTHLNSWDSILIFLQLLKKHCDFFFTFVSMTHSKKHILESKSVYSFTCTYKTETSFIKQHFPLIHSIHCDVLFVLFFPNTSSTYQIYFKNSLGS